MGLNDLTYIYNELLKGNLGVITPRVSLDISSLALKLIELKDWSNEEKNITDIILKISNILYNNTTIDEDYLPLNNGLYDRLIVLMEKVDGQYPVGAIPVQFEEQQEEDFSKENLCEIVNIDLEDKLYSKDLYGARANTVRPQTMCYIDNGPISKRIINTTHEYPELVGTLDKCKFVLNAETENMVDVSSVNIFERDFIQKHLYSGVIHPDQKFQMVGELKYDGVSVEAKVRGNRILKALSRGDTADNIATDLTPIFTNYVFPNASEVPTDIDFGIKFEAVITKRDLERLNELRGKNYVNCRNAIIGLLSSSDAYKYTDYITLIPLATSLKMNRLTELEFLNKYYNSGEYNRYCVFEGDYRSILFQVKQFTESAESIRVLLPYLIDGVVISYIDDGIKDILGRTNSVNKYSIAIKFNPKKAKTIFLGYSFNIGKSGDVIPMVHFKPCEFMGAINTKQTLHSYKRFKELNLIKGQEIIVEHRNDVLSYITKPDTEYNRLLEQQQTPEEFISKCPVCGSTIVISESGKSAKCPNVNCNARRIMRMVDLVDRLGIVDFSEERIRALNILSLNDLLSLDYDKASILGPINAQNIMNQIRYIMTNPINDYRIMSALGFDGMADESWKLILNLYSINDLMNMDNDTLYQSLIKINGIGKKMISIIQESRDRYQNDILTILSRFNIIESKGATKKPKIAFTGERDRSFIELLNNKGFDANERHSVTKDTYALITNDKSSKSSKIAKAIKYNIPIMTKQEFIDWKSIKI